jgi:glycosyltransferase involved in cell wall biosynthesis
MANSGWSWHLFAAPAIWIARMNRIPVVVNYRGGEAEVFLARAHRSVRATLQGVVRLVVPSPFLHQVFARYGIIADIVPNIVDLERFHPDDIALEPIEAAHIVVARNLEAIYDIPTALAAFVLVRRQLPSVRLTVAGSGPARDQLVAIAKRLGIEDAVTFTGSLNRDAIAALYRSASLMLNPSRADNMPNSVLEAMAAGVPVVSTNVGGVPFIIRDGVTGLLVQPGDDAAMAAAMLRILMTPAFAKALREAALRDVEQYAWPRVRQRWLDVYRSAIAVGRVAEKTA